MRQLILKMSVTLDGFVCGPNGELDWWAKGRSPEGKSWVEETIAGAGLHALGSSSFLAMADFWATSDDSLAPHMNGIPKAVFSRQPSLDVSAVRAQGWANSEVCTGDLAAQVARLKRQPGKYILAQGGAGFAQSLAAANLIDEYRLVVHPVAIGSGRSIFGTLSQPLDLKLRSVTLFPNGGSATVYRPA